MKQDFYKSVSKPLRDKLLFERAKDYAFEYMDGISERHVYPKEEDLLKLKSFYEPCLKSAQMKRKYCRHSTKMVRPIHWHRPAEGILDL